jgi:hypothetical protein
MVMIINKHNYNNKKCENEYDYPIKEYWENRHDYLVKLCKHYDLNIVRQLMKSYIFI